MKVARILQVLILLALLVYLLLLHNANQAHIKLPFLLSFPPAIVVGFALLFGWLFGWLPARLEAWRRGRRIRRLESRLAELEERLPHYEKAEWREGEPIIPDRSGTVQTPKSSPDYENF